MILILICFLLPCTYCCLYHGFCILGSRSWLVWISIFLTLIDVMHLSWSCMEVWSSLQDVLNNSWYSVIWFLTTTCTWRMMEFGHICFSCIFIYNYICLDELTYIKGKLMSDLTSFLNSLRYILIYEINWICIGSSTWSRFLHLTSLFSLFFSMINIKSIPKILI